MQSCVHVVTCWLIYLATTLHDVNLWLALSKGSTHHPLELWIWHSLFFLA